MEQLFTAIRAHVLQASHRAIRYIFFSKAQAPHKKGYRFCPLRKVAIPTVITLDFGFYSNEHRYKIMNKKQGIINIK